MDQETVVEWHRRLVEDLGQSMVGREGIVPMTALVGFFLIMGLVSAHYLRQQGDFEHKHQILWGAHWFWVIILTAEVIWTTGAYIALTKTLYTMTVVITSGLFAPFILWLFISRFPYQFAGAMFVGAIWRKRLRGDKFDLETWLNKQQQTTRWEKIGPIVVHLMHGVGACFYLYAVLSFSYPIDRMMIRSMEAHQLQGVFRESIQSASIRQIHAYSPKAKLAYPATRKGLLVALRSAKQIIGAAPRDVTPTAGKYYWQLFVELTPETVQSDARTIGDRAEKLLATLNTDHYWRITVYRKDKGVCVHRYYPRKTHSERRGDVGRLRATFAVAIRRML